MISLKTCFFFVSFGLSQFVETVRLNRKPFHVVGTSMGGNVAGVYAACYPAEICSMTLICPDGQPCVCVCVCTSFFFPSPHNLQLQTGLLSEKAAKAHLYSHLLFDRQRPDVIIIAHKTPPHSLFPPFLCGSPCLSSRHPFLILQA